MSTPFADPIAAGGGQLVIPMLRSPNYVPGVSGWIVRVDGSAEFNNLTIRGQFVGVNFVLSSLGLFLYRGAPATGNLFASIAPAAGADDGHGNAFRAGVTQYDALGNYVSMGAGSGANIVYGTSPSGAYDTDIYRFFDGTNTNVRTTVGLIADLMVSAGTFVKLLNQGGAPASVAATALLYAFVGHLKYVSTDGNAYNTGRATFIASGQSVASTSDVPITGITGISVAAGTYRVTGAIFGAQGGGAFANNIGFTGPAITSCAIGFRVLEGTAVFATGVLTSLGTFSTGVIPVLTTFETYFEGIINFSAAGATFGMRVNQGTAGHLWNINANSSLNLEPVA